jgi:outer membrane receptor protein involved in Fe transport
MKSLRLRSRSACPSVILGLIPALVLLTAQGAEAGPAPQPDPDPQTTPAPVADASATPAPLQEVVVTGSRIKVPANITATSPISVLSSEEIQLQGRTDMTDILNQLPQNIINSAQDFGNTSNPLSSPGGIATVDLRGLGPQRTLVLVDGRRLGVGDSNTSNSSPAPDIDQIPTALVERVDVVTGGASAVYGSDAMAGVVNFILRHDFQGIEVDGEYGFNQHSNRDGFIEGLENATASLDGTPAPSGGVTDGGRRDLSIIMGTNLAEGNGNITGYFVYHHTEPVPGSKYDFSDCLLVTYPPLGCNDSSNSNRFTVAGTQNRFTVVGNQFLPWPQAGSSPPAEFGSFAYEYQQREDDRYQGGVLSHFDINQYAKPYLEFSFMNDRTTEVVGPSALFSGSNPFTADNNYLVNCSNPLLSAQELGVIQSQGACTNAQVAADKLNPGSQNVDLDIGRRNVEGGGRIAYFEHMNYRAVVGLGGTLLDGVTYDAYAQYYYTSLYNSNQNYLNYASVNNALQATGTVANPVCVSGGSCVPYNIFTQGGVTAAQLAYLYTPGTAYGTNVEKIQHVDLTAELGKYGITSPFAQDGVAVNVGGEHRVESLDFQPDGAELSGDLAGFSGAVVAIDDAYDVSEAFTEVRIPLAQKIPFAHDLAVDAGYRYSDYSTAGTTGTYKFEVQYAPVEDVRFRFSLDKAVRAPNLIELYNPQSYGEQSFVGVDPCAPTLNKNNQLVAATATLAQCMHTGVTAAEYGNGGTTSTLSQCTGGQCGEVIGGNPHLQPEVAHTWSLGASFTPTFLPNLLLTLDYYHISISGEVGSIPGTYIFQQCLLYGTPADCSQIVRTPQGALHGATVAGGGYILQTSINTGASLDSGVDLGLAYKYRLERMGTLLLAMNGTYLQHDVSTPYPGAQSYDCAGLFGATCNFAANPNWRHTLRLSWDTPWRVLLSANWRFIGATHFDNNSPNPSLFGAEENGAFDAQNARISNYSYFDLTAVVHVIKGLELRAGVSNLFDKDPPLLPYEITNESQSNSLPSYDTLGRQMFVAFTAKY